MARQRKSSAQLEAEGAYRENPNRRRRAPKGRGAISSRPPQGLSEPAARAWREIVAALPQGVGTGSDVFVVEALARLIAKMRAGRRFRAADFNALRAYCNSLGLSPSARELLATPQTAENDRRWGEFAPDAERQEGRGAQPN